MQISDELMVQLVRQVNIATRTPVLFKDWARRWLVVYHKGRVKDNTYQGNYVGPVELHLIPWFGERSLPDILPIDVQAFFKAKSKTSAQQSLTKMKTCLRGIFETAIENDLCWKNPVTSTLRLYSKIEPRVKHTWSQKQYDIAFEFARRHQNGLSIMVLMETAMSRSELLGLRWTDLDLDNGLLRLQNGLVSLKNSDTEKLELVCDGLKNKYRRRELPLSAELLQLLSKKPHSIIVGGDNHRHTPAHIVTTQHIFHSPEGNPFTPSNWYHRILQPFMLELNAQYPQVPILTTHELRHTRATLLKDQGVDMYSIARLLGHCDLDMLIKRYAHDNPEALRIALGL